MTKPEDRDRNYYSQYTLEGKGEYYEDAGHFISSQDGGDAGKINLSAQEKHVNQRDYRAFERENHAMLEQGNYVRMPHVCGDEPMNSYAMQADTRYAPRMWG